MLHLSVKKKEKNEKERKRKTKKGHTNQTRVDRKIVILVKWTFFVIFSFFFFFWFQFSFLFFLSIAFVCSRNPFSWTLTARKRYFKVHLFWVYILLEVITFDILFFDDEIDHDVSLSTIWSREIYIYRDVYAHAHTFNERGKCFPRKSRSSGSSSSVRRRKLRPRFTTFGHSILK